MENILEDPPPWKTVKWIKSTAWTSETLPVFSYSSWILNQRDDISKTKEIIGIIDKEQKWELAKKMVNLYELVYTYNDDYLPPSLSLDQPLSRSYFKLIEMLDVLKFFDNKSLKLRTAHVAEGPGGFIQAVYYLASMKKKQIVSSIAMTLKPNTPHVPGWKKANAFLNKYKQIRIHYGEDGTGDIYYINNQDSFVKEVSPNVNLFTADGGFDFSIDYSSQEVDVYHLLLCSSIIGLQVLLVGGSFVLKLFDCNSPHTKHLIIILGRCFKQWTLYKPAITRPCNSERYFLGKDFRGIIPECLNILKEFESQSRQFRYPIIDLDIYTEEESTFLNNHITKSIDSQIKYINTAINISKNPEMWWSELISECIDKSAKWCDTFRVNSHPLRSYLKILSDKYPQISVKLPASH